MARCIRSPADISASLSTPCHVDQECYKPVDSICLEGTVSQNLDIGPSFIFMSKNGKILIIFS